MTLISTSQTAPQIVDELLERAVSLGASDLYFLPTHDGLLVEWRIDGVVAPVTTLASEVATNVLTRLKVMAGLLTYETRMPQEGRLRSDVLGKPLRVSTLPTVHGERVVVRVLSEQGSGLGRLHDLGLPEDVAATLSASLRQMNGAVLIVGPSGSGKSTTAYACLREIQSQSQGGRSIVTLEDPVEVLLPGIAQSQIDPAAGYSLARGLKALVRQDPEVIFVGEMRDAETARIAYQAAMTGQLLLTTFHSTDAAMAVERLLDLGAPASMVNAATRVIVAQRLLRRVCGCRINQPGRGCDTCDGLGYRGRVAIAEAIDFDTQKLVLPGSEGYDPNQRNRIGPGVGSLTLRGQAEELVRQGVTDQAEVDRVLGWTDND